MEQVFNINFHGSLGNTYGREPITLYATSVNDAMQGLFCNLGQSFKKTIRTGLWYITKGKLVVIGDEPTKEDTFITEKELNLLLPETELHIFPVIQGSGGGSAMGWIGAAILGGLIGLAIYGVITMVMSMSNNSPKVDNYANAEPIAQKPSFIFNGAVNVVEQGGPVPLIYGRHLAGSVIISAGITTERIQVK